MSEVTVLLVCFNRGRYLGQAIESVEAQTFRDWELVILDDGSTDPAAVEALDGAESRGHRVYRFAPTLEDRRATVRYATNINFGASVTESRWITYLSGDDYWFNDRLERMMRKSGQGFDAVYGPQLLLNEYDQKLGLRPPLGTLTDAWHQVDLNSVMHTREAFEKAGGWPTDPGLWTDADGHFWRRLHAAGYPFEPIDGQAPTDAKRYLKTSVTVNILEGRDPWHDSYEGALTDTPLWLAGQIT